MCFADICCRLKVCFLCFLVWINKMHSFDYFSFTAQFESFLFHFFSLWELVKVCECFGFCLCECFQFKSRAKRDHHILRCSTRVFLLSCSSRTIFSLFCILCTTCFFFVFTCGCFVVVISILQKAVPVLIFCLLFTSAVSKICQTWKKS